MERLKESSRSVITKDKERKVRIQELSSQSEVDRKNLQDLTCQYNVVVTKLNNQLGQAKVLQDDKKKLEDEKIRLEEKKTSLARVISRKTTFSSIINKFLPG